MLTEQLKYADFVQLSAKCNNKKPEELKLRYISCLKYLTEDDIQQIIQYIEKFGLEGQIFYQKNKIQIQQINYENKIKKEVNHGTISDQRAELSPPMLKKRRIMPQNQPQPQNYYQLSELQKHFIYQETPIQQELRFPTNPKLTQTQRMEQEQFQNYLHDLSLWYGIPMNKMITLLYSCSGSFNNLRQFLEDKNFYIYWKAEDDEMLKSEENLNPLFVSKGVTEVEKRKKWLGI